MQTEAEEPQQVHVQLQTDQVPAHTATEEQARVRQRVEELESFLVAASAEQEALIKASEASKAALTERVQELEQRLLSTCAPPSPEPAVKECGPAEPRGRGEDEGAQVLKQQLRATIDELIRSQQTAADQRLAIQQLQHQLEEEQRKSQAKVTSPHPHPGAALPACVHERYEQSSSPSGDACSASQHGGHSPHADKSSASCSLAGCCHAHSTSYSTSSTSHSALMHPSSLSISPNGSVSSSSTLSSRTETSATSFFSCASSATLSSRGSSAQAPCVSPSSPPLPRPPGLVSDGFRDSAVGDAVGMRDRAYSLTLTPHSPGSRSKPLSWI